MREVTDEALQRLYWACRCGSGFPGSIPDESNGSPSTTAILDALGLTPPLEATRQSVNLQNKVALSDFPSLSPHPPTSTSCSESPTQEEYLSSPTQSCVKITSADHQQEPGLSLVTTNGTSMVTATPSPRMSEQNSYPTSEHAGSDSKSATNNADGSHPRNSSSPNFDIDAYLDTSSCSIPLNVANPRYSMHGATKLERPVMTELNHIIHPMKTAPTQSDVVFEDCPPPWPGSLTAVCQTVTTPHTSSTITV